MWVHVGLLWFLKHVGTLIKLFRQISHRVFVNTYIKTSCEKEIIIGLAMFINDVFKHSRYLKLNFYMDCTSNLKTTFFFSN